MVKRKMKAHTLAADEGFHGGLERCCSLSLPDENQLLQVTAKICAARAKMPVAETPRVRAFKRLTSNSSATPA